MSDENSISRSRPIEVFCGYSHKDEALREELEAHVALLKRRGMIALWHDRRISAGKEWNDEISDHLNTADLILFLVSADFIASDYCYEKEMTRAMQRHELREARVIPIVVRDCDWYFAPFSKLQFLPKDGKPVLTWASRDEAFKDVAVGIRRAVEEMGQAPARPWREQKGASPSLSVQPAQTTKYAAPVRSPRDVRLYGPRIKITIGAPILDHANPNRPGKQHSSARFAETDALIDTGAQRTVLSPEAVERAGLPKIGQADLHAVAGVVRADLYAASLQFPRSNLKTIEVIEVCCCELPHVLYHCLLGRDVLTRWILNYDGPAGTWQISENKNASRVEPPEGFDPDLWGQ